MDDMVWNGVGGGPFLKTLEGIRVSGCDRRPQILPRDGGLDPLVSVQVQPGVTAVCKSSTGLLIDRIPLLLRPEGEMPFPSSFDHYSFEFF